MAPTPISLTPLESLQTFSHQIPSHKLIPNTSIQKKPLLIYHQAFPKATPPSTIEQHLSATSVVSPQWRYPMYSQTHFHSTTHEVLCVYSGSARLCFGGESNPGRVEPFLESGDVIIVPAGVGHRLLEDLSGESGEGFMMVGAYPVGKAWDMCYGKKDEEEKVRRIDNLRWFERDPVYGDEGPVLGV